MVSEQRKRGNNVRWDNYDIVFWREDFRGFGSTGGEFNRKTGKWGFANRVKVNSEGIWSIDERNIRSSRRPRTRR
jgi:hypothetical protein